MTVLTLAGRLVLEDGEAPLRERIDALAQDVRVDIVLNVNDVTCIDSCGIGTIVGRFVSLKRRGGHLKLVCPSARCRRVLEITHLLPVFDVYDTEEAAIDSLNLVTR